MLAAQAMAQTTEGSASERFWRAFNETTSVGVVPKAERHDGWKGWFADAWDGSKRIFRDGHTDLMLPLYTFHPAYKYPNRDDQNHYPWGGGIARTWIDGRDNERLVYAMAFSDSHYDFQPVAGYGWIARWPLFAGLKGGLGYTAFVSMRADSKYFPFPAILPLASVGTDRFTVYGTWIPTTDVLFFFARISLPNGEGASPPAAAAHGIGAAGAPGFRRNLIYAAAAYVNSDAGGIDTVRSDNASAPVIGYRRFLTEDIALDLTASRSKHTLDYGGSTIGTFEQVPITLAAQYHLPAWRGLHLFAGVGVTYTRLTEQNLPGYSLESSSVSPAVQAGATFAVTESLLLTGGLSASFPRNELRQDGAGLGTLTLSPVTFHIGVGWSF
jgi:outer membrane protein W